MLWLYLFIIVFLAVVFLSTRLFSLKNEVKKIGRQVEDYNHQRTNKKIDMALLDQNIEELGAEINYLIDLHVKEKRERIRFENELKQAVANMSHDLRTPLTSILGYIQMAESNEVPEVERKEYISIAKNRAKRLETLLNDFFELSVIESADYQLQSEKFNMKNLTIDVLMRFYDRFNDKNMEPIINMPEHDVFITTDKSAATRVMENLILNAISHSSGNVAVMLEEKESAVRLMVQNEAHTLTEKDVELLFDRFYMADQSRSGKNTGLGLSIVKSLMEKMNGTITGELKDGQLKIICEWKT
ncbi:Histidine kinase-, DNA gyrase B-, and HSP90-like ATPase [Lentibacillus halodurans]|uniref:histidine kinase n=1 Tax=Lentibacillus halodurans TaxID=237679 RepID=A0A1I0YQA0_9BACI|nr:HAMP domain-containing sensor histidine kinase [Lentibacillus halodurans]SFB15559.1 Histidine kinase-, DNA gyrase B-, and HSP90-like ATPase [Lentibacillus halodurans]